MSLGSSEIGEQGAVSFMLACLSRGLLIATPVAHAPYDLVVHNPNTDRMWRVQIKTASPDRKKPGRYICATKRRPQHYRSVQVFAFWNRGENRFWLVPREEFIERKYRRSPRQDGLPNERTGTVLYVDDEHWEKWKVFDIDTKLA